MKRILLLAAMALLMAISAIAQTTGTIRGQVADPTGAMIPNATVTITGEYIQGKRTTTTDQSGSFHILTLPPGKYTAEFSMKGFATVRESGVLRAGQTITLTPVLKPAGATDEVLVSAKANLDTPIVDTTSASQRYNVSGEFINNLPLGSDRNWNAIWYMIPGAYVAGSDRIDPEVHGSRYNQNNYKLDGFEIGDAFGNQGWIAQFSPELIQDVNVVTSGPDASRGLGSGGYINIVSKSGSNNYHGSGGIYFQPRGWNWSNVKGGIPSRKTLYQADAAFGGRIVRDRLWFYSTYRYTHANTGIQRSAESMDKFRQYGLPVQSYDLQDRNNYFTTKLSATLTSKHAFEFKLWRESTKQLNGDAYEQYDEDATINYDTRSWSGQAKWTATFSPTFLLTTALQYRNNSNSFFGHGGNNPSRVLYVGPLTTSAGLPSGAYDNALLYYGNRAGNANWSDGKRPHAEVNTDATYFLSGLRGSHTFQFGVQLKPITKYYNTTHRGNPSYIYELLAADGKTRIPFRQLRYENLVSSAGGRSSKQISGYVMDTWNPTSSLTLNLGVRFDAQKNIDRNGDSNMATVSIDPRFGVAYSLSKRTKDVLRFSWGRIHDIVTLQYGPSYGLGGKTEAYYYDYDPTKDANGNWAPVGNLSAHEYHPEVWSSALPLSFRNPDVHGGHTDEIHAGYSRQLPAKVLLDVGWTHKKSSDAMTSYDANLKVVDNKWAGVMDPTYTSLSLPINNTWSWTVYDAVETGLSRNFGGKLQTIATYTYAKMRNKGGFQPGTKEYYYYKDKPENWYENSTGRPHIFRLNGSYLLPRKFSVGAIFSFQSGEATGPIYKYLNTNSTTGGADYVEYTNYGPASMVVNGRTIYNPFTNNVRYNGPASQGQLRSPMMPMLNTRFGKVFTVREGHSLAFNVDVFNLPNDGTGEWIQSSYINTSGLKPNPTFGRVSTYTQNPRGIQVSMRYEF